MTKASERLRAAITAVDSERYYNGHIPSYVTELASAAAAYMSAAKSPAPTLRDVFPEGQWEIEDEQEGGQPNGLGEIESNDSREWFYTENETHHREIYHVYGPWQEGPTHMEAARRQREAERRAALAEEAARVKEAKRPSKEDEILRKAEEILARRSIEGAQSGT